MEIPFFPTTGGNEPWFPWDVAVWAFLAAMALGLLVGSFVFLGRRRRRKSSNSEERMRRIWFRRVAMEDEIEEMVREEERAESRDAVAWLAATGALAGRAHSLVSDLIGSMRLSIRRIRARRAGRH
ncbi:hypothetical protein D6833_05010 [Candidatus Parcubacteria bacterium]|nr:MAG: hypothetical protein D6833_05010 [Candidatus Parcubacteria bacterium]